MVKHASPQSTLFDMMDGHMPKAPIPLFVYGTLRPGGALHRHWLEGFGTRRATAHGYALMARDNLGYPYMVHDSKRRVVGDVTYIDSVHLFVRLAQMELRVGYDLHVAPVHVVDEEEAEYAFTFIYPRLERGLRVIESGDWLKDGTHFLPEQVRYGN